jgi:integrase
MLPSFRGKAGCFPAEEKESMEFTKASVAALGVPVGKPEQIVWDDTLPGFGCRVRAGGSKTWVVQYRLNGRQRRESLGDIRKIELADARRIAKQSFAKVGLGVDPRGDSKPTLTLGKVVPMYLDAKRDLLRRGSYEQAQLHLTKYWKPLAGLGLAAITRADVAAILQSITKEHGRVAASRARSNLATLFAWAMREGMVENNPVVATNDPARGILPRDRVLSDEELVAVWNACQDDDLGRIIKLLILTGCRREEIGQLKWNEIDFTAGTITISGERIKNKRTHLLPLPAMAIDILKGIQKRSGGFVFGGERSRAGFNAYSYSSMTLNTRIALARGGRPLEHWTIHDLRRSFRTGLGRIGVPPHVAELAINHVKGGVEAIYDRHTYQPQIKAALAAWAAHIERLLSGAEDDKVVALR